MDDRLSVAKVLVLYRVPNSYFGTVSYLKVYVQYYYRISLSQDGERRLLHDRRQD